MSYRKRTEVLFVRAVDFKKNLGTIKDGWIQKSPTKMDSDEFSRA